MPHSYDDLNDINLSPLLNVLYDSKKSLMFRYGTKSLSKILNYAVTNRNLRDVKACIQHGISSEAFESALNKSVSCRSANIVLFLLNNWHPELLSRKSDILKKVLFEQCLNAEIATLIQQADPELQLTQEELTEYLFKVVKLRYLSMVEWACQQGADVNAIQPAPGIFSGDSTYTPLMWAVYFSDMPLIKMLCKYGADIEKEAILIKQPSSEEKGSALDLSRKYNEKIFKLLQSMLDVKKESAAHCFFKQINTDISSSPTVKKTIPSLSEESEALIASYCGFGQTST